MFSQTDNYNTTNKNGFEKSLHVSKNIGTDYSYKFQIIWGNVVFFVFIHSMALWGLWICVCGQVKWETMLWGYFLAYATGEGVTIGAHRLYTHKSFKAKPPLKFLLILMQTTSGQITMYSWVRDHRLHHRCSDTDADPHNAKRGFFFSHVGWLMCKKHPKVIEMGKTIDMSDLEADWMVMCQKKYFAPLFIIVGLLIPIGVPIYFFGEKLLNSILVALFLRYVYVLNCTWAVNSVAHLYGTRPYDKNLQPVESALVSFLTWGEGWHNYHHAYPWDYKTAELGMSINFSSTFIECFEKLGLAYDLKTAPDDVVRRRILRTGDGTHWQLGSKHAHAAAAAASAADANPAPEASEHATPTRQ